MSNKTILVIGLLITVGVAAFLFWPGSPMQKAASDAKEVVIYKNPGCQCCAVWADYMSDNDFEVEEIATPAMPKIKADNGITYEISSCHTAFVDGYVVEGHVPADDIKRLIAEKPENVIGLTVPGMPVGSPGMEMPGRAPDHYEVLLIHDNGETSVYSTHN